MSENKTSVLPDIIEPISNAVQQNLPETAAETDGALSTLVGFFNHVVLYPIKKANITYKYKLESFKDDLEQKIKDIPEENLQVPPVSIAGPVLEALKYTYDEEELREMYENLLASAMDNRKAKETHPAFVDAIRQMTPLDAKIFDILSKNDHIKCAHVKFCVVGTTLYYPKAMPEHFVMELYGLDDPFVISASLINLDRLGLIDITMSGLREGNYHVFKSHPYTLERKKIIDSFGKEIEIKIEEHGIIVNNYGMQFANTCLSNTK